MKTQRLKISSYEDMTRLWTRANLPHKPNGRDSRKAIAAQMRANPDFFLGAFENNHLIGTVIASTDQRKGWINRLAVDPDYRRRGTAQALVAAAEKTLRKHGIRIFCAQIEDYNTASKQLLEKCGYTEHRDIVYFSKRDSQDV